MVRIIVREGINLKSLATHLRCGETFNKKQTISDSEHLSDQEKSNERS